MSQEYSSTKRNNFKHLTERERYSIEILLQQKLSAIEIAKILGKHKRTIEREILRGIVVLLSSDLLPVKRYCADVGQRIYCENGANKGPSLKIGRDHKLAQHIEKKIIKEKYSPDAVIGELRAKKIEFETSICTKTLYNYIDNEIFANITNKDLPVKRKAGKSPQRRSRIAHRNLKGTSIAARPENVETREEYGHWEMDLVVGGVSKGKAALLVLTERKNRQQIIRRIPDKTQNTVQKALDKLERSYGTRFQKCFMTVTVDNGSEFLNYEQLERSILKPNCKRFKLYYAHPYSAWERGSNENANKLIRRFIPKGSNIAAFNNKDIQRIENWMNNYPRRIHGYRSANDMAA